MKRMLLGIVRFYQRHISPLSPGKCRFVPTCSQYAVEAIEKYGAWEGRLAVSLALASVQPLQ